MAIQSFSVGQVLTAAQVNALQANDYNQTVNAKTASYTLVAADKGTRITMSSTSATTITVNTSLFSAGDTLFIQNLNTGVSTITAGTATVTTASSLALAQWEGGTLYFTSASAAIFIKGAGAAAGGGGKVLQVVYGSSATEVANSTTTFADTNLSATITPSSATSKVLILVSHPDVNKNSTSSGSSIITRLLRGATAILDPITTYQAYTNTNVNNTTSISVNYLDSPATTSATTYKTQFANRAASAAVYINLNGAATSTMILMEIGA